MRPNNKRAEEEKAAEEARKAEGKDVPIRKEAPRIVWFKATDKRVPLIAIPIEQAPADFVDNNENYANRLFVVRLEFQTFNDMTRKVPFLTITIHCRDLLSAGRSHPCILLDLLNGNSEWSLTWMSRLWLFWQITM